MKSLTKTKRSAALRLLVLILSLTVCIFALASCDVINGLLGKKPCTEHVDADGDATCDICGDKSSTACTEHVDEDGDKSCDRCGGKMQTGSQPEHTDHSDGNGDGVCDSCGKTLISPPCTRHYDDNSDGSCDFCGAAMPKPPCTEHIDADCSGRCDSCDASIPISHTDTNGDGECDKCETCLEHRDGDCNDLCDNCGAAVSIGHVNEDGNSRCDKCNACIKHTDSGCDGSCDECGADMEIMHSDPNNDNICNKCGAQILPVRVSARKTASVAEGGALYPAYYIAWNDTTYRGAYVTYTITVTNEGEGTATVEVTDLLSEHAELVRGCDSIVNGRLSWILTVPTGSEASVSYTVAVKAQNTDGAYIDGGNATVGGEAVDCYDLYIKPTLNEVDQKYIEKAIKLLSGSTFTALDFAKHAYTVAFTNPKAITELMSGTPEAVLELIMAGTDEKLSSAAVFSSATGARALGAKVLTSGDLVFVGTASGTRLYMICGAEAYDITEKATKVDISSLISAANAAESYAVVRPSYTMSLFTPSNPDETPVAMNSYQEAIVRTAEAYLLRGESLQYEDVNFGLTSTTGEYRWACGEKAPEEYTSDEWGYVNCAVFTYDVYLAALGYSLPSKMYTTERLTLNSEANGMRVFNFERERADVYTAEEQLQIERQFMQLLEVGDIIVRRHTNVSTGKTTGHAMLYVGNGRFIHSGGASYKSVSGVGSEVYEPTIRCHKVHDYLFGAATTSMFNDEYNNITVVRPLNVFAGEIPENTAARVENMQDIRAEKLSSAPSSVTVNPGDLITFTFSIFNVGDAAKTISVYDKLPAGTVYVSGGDTHSGDELFWTVTVGAGETVSVSYTVRVDNVADGTLIDGRDAKVGGVMHRCAAIRVKNTLTATEQNAIKGAIDELSSEGTSLTKLELVNEIYKRALGIEGIFTDTNVNNVIRDGAESVFAQSSKKNGSRYLSMLRTDETYFSRMLADHLYGGMRFDSSAKLYDRTRLLKTHNLVVGDVLIARSSSAENVYIYAGDGELLLLNSGVGDPVNFTTVAERILYFGRDFAVLRPSQVLGG